MDYSKVDKDGKELNTVPKANQEKQAGYYDRWIESGKTWGEPTPEDIKCELQLDALCDFEPLK